MEYVFLFFVAVAGAFTWSGTHNIDIASAVFFGLLAVGIPLVALCDELHDISARQK